MELEEKRVELLPKLNDEQTNHLKLIDDENI